MNTSRSLNKELAPCPFCGANRAVKTFNNIRGHHIICDARGEPSERGCGASIGWNATEAEAVAAWNRRASTPSALPVEGAESLARKFHEAYERLAPSFGYETRPETRSFDATSPNGQLMIAVCAAIVGTPSKEGAAQVEASDNFEGVRPPMCRISGVNPDVLRRAALATPPASPSEGGEEPTPVWSRKMPLHPGCEHACQQAQDYGVWPESSCRPTCAYLAREPHPEDIEGNLAASRGEAVDAARYRWLRDQADSDNEEPHCTIHKTNDWGKWFNEWTTGEALDEAIDAAIQSQGAKP